MIIVGIVVILALATYASYRVAGRPGLGDWAGYGDLARMFWGAACVTAGIVLALAWWVFCLYQGR